MSRSCCSSNSCDSSLSSVSKPPASQSLQGYHDRALSPFGTQSRSTRRNSAATAMTCTTLTSTRASSQTFQHFEGAPNPRKTHPITRKNDCMAAL